MKFDISMIFFNILRLGSVKMRYRPNNNHFISNFILSIEPFLMQFIYTLRKNFMLEISIF